MMLAESVVRLGGAPVVYDPDPEAPACRAARLQVQGAWNDDARLAEFVAMCDVVTYEFENVDSEPLRPFVGRVPIHPSVDVLAVAQNRVREKQFLRDHALPHVRFAVADTVETFRAAATAFGFPFIVKTARGGYDGKGQWRVDGPSSMEAFVQSASRDGVAFVPVVLEEVVDMVLEASCIVARDASGVEVSFPVFENVHQDHILDTTVVPASVSAAVATAMREIAVRSARELDLVGLLTTEFFVGRPGVGVTSGVDVEDMRIFVNEFAPRPHNSGHVTRSACTASQYDLLARVLLGVPLTEPRMVAPGAFAMANLLGDVWLAQGRTEDLDLAPWRDHPDVVDVVLYGKRGAAMRRKMGHAVTYGADGVTARAKAVAFREALCQHEPHDRRGNLSSS